MGGDGNGGIRFVGPACAAGSFGWDVDIDGPPPAPRRLKKGPARWSPTEEIGWSLTQKIRWSPTPGNRVGLNGGNLPFTALRRPRGIETEHVVFGQYVRGKSSQNSHSIEAWAAHQHEGAADVDLDMRRRLSPA